MQERCNDPIRRGGARRRAFDALSRRPLGIPLRLPFRREGRSAVLHLATRVGAPALTVLAAWLAARGIGESTLQSLAAGVDLSGGSAAAASATPQAVPPPITIDDLLAAGLFPDPPDPPGPPSAGREDPAPQPAALPAAGGPPRPCILPWRVVALVAARAAPARSLASIEGSGGVVEYRVGDHLDDAVVTRIARDRVYLRRSGETAECYLDIREPTPPAAAAGAAAPGGPDTPTFPEPMPPPAESGPEQRLAEAMDAIERTGDGEYDVPRALVRTVADDPDAAVGSMRVTPAKDGDTVLGFRLHGVRPGSLPGRLGLQNGDVVAAVNGLPMTSMDNVLRAYGLLRMADEITAEVLRRGERVSLTYRLR